MELQFELPEGHFYLPVSKLLALEDSIAFLKECSSHVYELAKTDKCYFVTAEGKIHSRTEDIKKSIISTFEARVEREKLLLELKQTQSQLS